MDYRRSITAVIGLSLALSACSSGGGSIPSASAVSPVAPSQHAIQKATFEAFVPNTARSAALHHRSPDYISPGSNGLLVTAAAQSAPGTVLATSAVDISASSTACVPTTGGRLCTFTIPAPGGADFFDVAAYDQAPVNGAIPAGANKLSEGFVDETIVLGTTNTIAVTLDALIAGLKLGPIPSSGLATTALTAPIPIQALDAQGYTIVTGTADQAATNPTTADVYTTPLTLTLTETLAAGDTSHVSLLEDGTKATATPVTSGSTVTTTLTTNVSSHLFSFSYDGAALPGYSLTIALSTTQSGVGTVTALFAPLFVSGGTSPYVTTTNGLPAIQFTQPGQTAPLTISEAGAPTFTLTEQTAGGSCAQTPPASYDASGTLATTNGVTTATFTALGTAGGPCTFTLSDGSTTLSIPVTLTITGTSTTVPGAYVFMTDFSTGNILEFDRRATGTTATTGPTSPVPLNVNPPSVSGLTSPGDIKVDTTTKALVVSDSSNDTISIFKTFPFTTAPDVVLGLTGYSPIGFSIDEVHGNLYVAVTPTGGAVAEGKRRRPAVVNGAAAGLIEIANYASLASGSVTPTAVVPLSASPENVEDVATDGTDIFLATQQGLYIYATAGLSAASAPVASFSYLSGFSDALDSHGNLYVGQPGTGPSAGIVVYSHATLATAIANGGDSTAPYDTSITLGGADIANEYVDSSGNVFFTTDNDGTDPGYLQYSPLTDSSGALTLTAQQQRYVVGAAEGQPPTASMIVGAAGITLY